MKEEAKIQKRTAQEISPDTAAFIVRDRISTGSGSSYRHSNSGRSQFNTGNTYQQANHGRSQYNTGTGYQPTGSNYQAPRPRGNMFPQTSFGDKQPPYNPRLMSSRRDAEIAELKARSRCNKCGRYGHWWEDCNVQDIPAHIQRRQARAHFAEVDEPELIHHTVPQPVEFIPEVESYPNPGYTDQESFYDSENPSDHYSLDFQADHQTDFTDDITRAFMANHISFESHLSDIWIADSGANNHVTHNLQWFTDYKPLPPGQIWPISAVGGHKCFVAGTGHIKILIQLPNKTEIAMLENVLYVPGFGCNLFSVTLVARKYDIHFVGKQNTCDLIQNGELVMTGRMKQDLYCLDCTVIMPPAVANYAASFGNIPLNQEAQTLQIWHNRLAHIHYDMIKKMARKDAVQGLKIVGKDPDTICAGCQFGKSARQKFPENKPRGTVRFPGMLIHSDICGPMSVPSHGGSLYFIIFKDDFSSYRFVFCISRKSEALDCFKRVVTEVNNKTGRLVQILRTDNGREYVNNAFRAYLLDRHIRHETTTPYTPQQNGVAERENRTIMEGVRSCLHHSRLSFKFWAEAVSYIVYTLNRTSTRLLDDFTPYEAWTDQIPSVSHMRPFGCLCYIHVPDALRKKLDPKSRRGLFMGYADNSKAYRVWDIEKKTVVLSRDVHFDERSFQDSDQSSQASSSSQNSASDFIWIPSQPSVPSRLETAPSVPPSMTQAAQPPSASTPVAQPSVTTQATQPSASTQPMVTAHSEEQGQTLNVNNHPSQIPPDPGFQVLPIEDDAHQLVQNPQEPLQQHGSEITSPLGRGRRTINPPQRLGEWYCFTAMASTLPKVPTTYEEAINSPQAEQWKKSMEAEFDSLLLNKTWCLEDLPPGRKPIRCKWVYTLKLKPDGSLDRYKSRLVAKGCSQVPGVDFKQTFSPTVKYDSIRIVLAIVAAQDMEMVQFDITTAFLNGALEEEIYMVQVPGFEEKATPKKVCRLLKSLYGLRQASRAWHHRLTEFLKTHKLVQTSADSCVYFSAEPPYLIVTIFVDDGLVCCVDKHRIDAVLKSMVGVFITKVSDPETYVGIHIVRDRPKRLLYIDQKLYIHKLLETYGYSNCSTSATPADHNLHLQSASLGENEEPVTFPFSEVVGSCQFAALTTRPDISFATSNAATYKSKPTHAHCKAVGRILKYLKDTSNLSICYGGSKADGVLKAYTDADYANDNSDRKSRSGYVLYFNGGPVAWGSKK